MPDVITINRPDVVALIEEAAKKLTGGDKTEAVALGMRRLLDQTARRGSLFGAHPDRSAFVRGSTLSPRSSGRRRASLKRECGDSRCPIDRRRV
jgi:hypothetical protein